LRGGNVVWNVKKETVSNTSNLYTPAQPSRGDYKDQGAANKILYSEQTLGEVEPGALF
jgi:hypothetical protein